MDPATDRTPPRTVPRPVPSPHGLLACLDGVADGVIIGDLAGNLTYWNPAALRVHGYDGPDSGEQARRHLTAFPDVFAVADPDGRPVPFERWPFSRLLRGEPVVALECHVTRRDTGQARVLQFDGAIVGTGDDRQAVLTIRDLTDRRRSAQTLAVLAAIVEHSDDAIVGKDLGGTITSWNRAAERMFGYPAAEAVGRPVTMLLPADRADEEGDILARVRAGEGIEHFESQRVAKGGRVIDVSLTISPIRDGGGRVIGASKIARDITAKLAAERDLRASHALFRSLVEGIADPVYIKDLDGRYLLGNAALGRVLGRPTADVVGLTNEDVLAPADAAAVRAAEARVMAGGEPQTYEERATIRGEAREFLTTKGPYRDADGRLAGVLGISREVTALKAAERAVADSERHLREVLDGLLMYVAVVRPGGRLTGMNRALRQALLGHGVPAEVIDGQPLFEPLLAGVSADVRAQLRAAIGAATMGEAVRLGAVPLVPGPPPVLLDLMLSPMREPDGRVTHLIISAVDATDRERSAAQARERQQALAHLERVRTMGQMAAGLAHELNQPFAAIANYAAAARRLLAGGRLPADRIAQTLADVGAEAMRAGAIVQRLRGFVQKQQPQPHPVDVNAVVIDALRLFAFDLRQADVSTTTSLAGDLPPVLADPVQIGQVLVNLIRNALDAIGDLGPDADPSRRAVAVGTAAVDLSTGGRGVRVSVRDAGCGVDPADLARVFDAFYTTKPAGLGIGLALCRTILEEHGGHLTAGPNADGVGMTFAFTLRPAESVDDK